MPNCKSFLVTKTERKHVRRRARFQQHRDACCHQFFFFLQGKVPKEIHSILMETLVEHAPSYTAVKNWVDWLRAYQHHLIYRVSQEECARLREGVVYVKVY